MGIFWRFFLNDLEIEEPIGFSSLELSIKRDDKMHGMQFEASTSALQFYGEASEFLREQKRLYGLKAEVIFLAESKCDATEPTTGITAGVGLPYTLPFALDAPVATDTGYEEALKGRLNFGKYKESCGGDCLVTLPVETDTCEVTFKNRFDQKVNVDVAKGFDGATVLPDYFGLSQTKTLKAKALSVIDEAQNSTPKVPSMSTEVISLQNDWQMNEPPNTLDGHIAPRLDKIVNASLGTFTPSNFTQLYANGAANRPGENFGYTVDTTSLIGTIKCGLSNAIVSFRLKGNHAITAPGISTMSANIKVFKLPAGALPDSFSWVQLYDFPLTPAVSPGGSATYTATFDKEGSFNFALVQGDKLTFSIYIRTTRFAEITSYSMTIDPETFFKVSADSLCEDSDVDLNLIHETLSRVTEAITDYCMRVKSSYYGRIDSEPFAFPNDGCGGLRWLTSGLKIRRAIEDNFFVSLKELVEGLLAIDNTGMGVEPDPTRDGFFVLRIEGLDFFYNDSELMFHDAIPEAMSEVDESKHYSKIMVGYKKWEVQRINGLDEYNSNREYRTSLTSVSNTLDITSNLVAGGYPIEVTRQQSFADTGGADTTYDNETFIITALRNAYGYEPEQDNITDPENIYSPSTAYNFKLSPVRNLMRWYRGIINSYATVADSENKLYFNSGTGNTVAAGMQSGNISQDCIMENQVIHENQDVFTSQFTRVQDFTPLYKNETITYEYPMSLADYKKIKANPYGFIRYQCGNGPEEKGYIKEVKHRLAQGMASITLKKKW